MASKYNVVVTDDRYGSYEEEQRVFEKYNIDFNVHNFSNEQEAIEGLKNVEGILVNLFPLNSRIIKGLSRCRVISRYGVGYDNVEIKAADEMGIQVCNVPDYSYEDVSDHALALLFSCIRKTNYKDRLIRQGKWNLHKDYPCYRINGKTLGIIGFGLIGRTLLRKVSGLGLRQVLVCDPFVDKQEIINAGGVPAGLEKLAAKADYISIHAPINDKTRHMFDKALFSKMGMGKILINTSRGSLIDEAALCNALNTGILSSAGLDVFEIEPLPAKSKLKEYDTVVLSDHTGYYTEESLFELKTKAARNIVEVLNGQEVTYPVNMRKK